MTLRQKLFRGALTLGAGQALAQALSFARKIILARLLTQADFGIAATFALTYTFLEMATNMAAEKLLVQSRDGDHERMQGAVHAYEVLRGVVMAIALFALAGPIARVFDVPQATWAFQLLAVAPLLRGFRHQDIARVQRDMRFAPMVVVEVVSQAVVVAAAWPLTVWLGDYSAVLYLVLLREAMLLVMSHLVARRRYVIAFDPDRLGHVLRFGWPLLVNGLLLYAALQGDRFLVGVAYEMEDLAVYAAAVYLALTPVLALAKVHSSLVLPVLSRAQDAQERFVRGHRASARGLAAFAIAFSVGCIMLGGELMGLAYGERYADGGLILAWLGAASAVRLLRAAQSEAAIAKGDTKNLVHANLARLLGVAAAAGFAYGGHELWTVAAAGFGGEVAAMVVAANRLHRLHKTPWRASLIPLIVLLMSIAAGFVGMHFLKTLGSRVVAVSAVLGVVSVWGWMWWTKGEISKSERRNPLTVDDSNPSSGVGR